MSQTKKDYAENWKKVEALEKKGLPKSALKEVTNIYSLAVKDNNDAQQIRSAIFQIYYRAKIEEDADRYNVFFADTLITKAKAPAKNILISMQAEMYWRYLQDHRWQIYGRTILKNEVSKDLSTWSIDQLIQTISKLYQASLQNETILKSTKLETFDAVIVKGINTRQLRPTLYDFLAQRALDFFTTDENNITQPAYQFTINQAEASAPAAQFVKAAFTTADSSSLQHKALLLYQEILRFHLTDAQPDALVDADISRIKFVHEHSVLKDKDQQYEAVLQQLEKAYSNNPISGRATYLLAKFYNENGSDYDPFNKTTHQFEKRKAKEMCEVVIKKFPESEASYEAANLVNDIIKPTLSVEAEKVNTINDPFRMLVQYTNVPQVYVRIIKTNSDELEKINKKDYDELWKSYTAMKAIKSWNVTLPDQKDYQQHSAEIKADGLPGGLYLVLCSIDPNFALDKNIITAQKIYVSNISYISYNQNTFFVLDRNTGQPLNNAAVQLWENNYNYATSKYELAKKEKYTSNNNGSFTVPGQKSSRSFLLQIKYNADELFLNNDEVYVPYNSYNEQEYKPGTFIVTDRSLYRPGQTVYFKGIVVQRDKDASKSAVKAGFSTTIRLRDANDKKIADVNVTSNDYGSFHGSFVLPSNALNGYFSIIDTITNSSAYISVEEYKRPKFSTTIEKPKGTYRINDTITVTGTAKAYAGNTIDGAKVKYTVVRKVQYPVWWNWGFSRRNVYGRNNQQEITQGETTTDAKGEFHINFAALPDESVDKKAQPVFTYEVNADVTDLNGETRSGQTYVAVGYQSLQLSINLPEKMPADSLNNLHISSTNMNDIFESSRVKVAVTKLTSPTKIYRERYWDRPDVFTMTAAEYSNTFPYDIYSNEDETKSWPLAEQVLNTTDTTREDNLYSTGKTKFSAGWYKIEATTTDKDGETVKAEKYIQLTGSTPSVSEAVNINIPEAVSAPGQTVPYSITTGFDTTWLIHVISRMDENNSTTVVPVTQHQYSNSLLITEQDRGGISLNYAFVQHNRVYSGSEQVSVPWNNKDLNITYGTFRDKLLPGSKEKITMTVSGNKGEKVMAEAVAAMYDASLDQFKPHIWPGLDYLWPSLNNYTNWEKESNFKSVEAEQYDQTGNDHPKEYPKLYDNLALYDPIREGYYGLQHDLNPDIRYNSGTGSKRVSNLVLAQQLFAVNKKPNYGRLSVTAILTNQKSSRIGNLEERAGKSGSYDYLSYDVGATALRYDANGTVTSAVPFLSIGDSSNPAQGNQSASPRKNFNETAFFFPDLKTDADGNISFEYTVPEALTQWKLMTFAHTKALASGYTEKKIVTQKPLMVQPNAPRFLREGDRMEFSAKIVNLSDSEITGIAQLELIDAATNTPVDGWFKNVFPNQYFTVAAGQSAAVKFPMEVPFNFNSSMSYRIVAKAGNFSDGEEMAIPVLTNRTLVTESLPLHLKAGESKKTFQFSKLLKSPPSEGFGEALTVEYTSNPIWTAIQSLPYLMEFPHECAEQTFNRYYANALAAYISNSNPKIKTVFEKWKSTDTSALQSNLEKNPELKAVLLEETPWVLDAQNETQQRKNIALLFDLVRMSNEQQKALNTVADMQSSNGGFTWFKGGPDDRYITQYIVTSIGHLKKLGVINLNNNNDLKRIANNALPYLDKKIKEEYDNLEKNKVKLANNNLSYNAIQYLYMRSFFKEYKTDKAAQPAVDYFTRQAKQYWLKQSKYMQAMIALALFRNGDAVTPKAILASLKENAINNNELGMYWPQAPAGKGWNEGGYFWYQAPVESQALMIEAFTDIDKNTSTISDLKTWLLKQKQTQSWKTTKATAEACYALLISPLTPKGGIGSADLSATNPIEIQLGNTIIKTNDASAEAGTGYIKKRIEGKDITPEMGNITVTNTLNKNNPAAAGSYGAVYWQYFEDLDKITPAATPLQLKKQLFVERNTDKGPVLEAIADEGALKVGDKVKVRIELKVDRDMEYVHMKDMRAACMEPVNVLSEYKWQDGLGYYESTKDAGTHFFFNWLNRGTYVFEYTLFVTHAGNFSNGITTIESMYAPEFNAHSEGIRVSVE
ncbi:MAG: alpha-2-macroglobulin [Bacteroidetes bacterium]|nr:alpha-2-macroglobulin [Bacteroidota bacterium]